MLTKFTAVFLIFGCIMHSVSATDQMTPEELERWFQSDTMDSAPQVNEGQLKFLVSPPAKPVLHSHNEFTIDQVSIDQGWVKLLQCYQNLDAVPVAEVVYRYKFMQNLTIHSTKNIGKAQVVDQSVQLEDIQRNARLCITAEIRNFYQNEDKTFSLVNGPYHRKFLDGYYPYHLTYVIRYTSQLRFVASNPTDQSGFRVTLKPQHIELDSWFEGMLNTEFNFVEDK